MIGLYRTSEDADRYLEVVVAYETLTKEINGSDWLYHILELMGETIIDKQESFFESGNYTDVLTKKTFGDETMISRFKVIKDSDEESGGANLFLIKATCHEKNYIALHEDMLQSISWLFIINGNEWKLAEILKSITIKIPDNLYFYYPGSWSVRKIDIQMENFSHYVLSREIERKPKTMMNLFFMILNKDDTVQFVFETMYKRIAKIASTTIPTLVKVDNVFNKHIDELWHGEAQATTEDNLSHTVLNVYVGKTGGVWFYAEAISPRQEDSFYIWAVNKRALEIVVNSLNNSDLI
ncbi:hypothetical protein AB1E22_08000 [Buttiauxella gaviniae]|uniref:Uncharacterized protein n=1 Tax=Buttiauxella gaviniae TaxID=82990 RepID=A0ABV3NT10_9ENTR